MALTSQSCPKTSEKSARSPISEVGARRSRQQHVAPSHFQSRMPTYRCPRRSHPSFHSLAPYTFTESKVGKSIVASHVRCSDADLRSTGASPCMRRVASTRVLAESASLSTRQPLACHLSSVSMTLSTMSWHGHAEQPMRPRSWSVPAGVPDAQGPSSWTRVARRVWFAAV